ncbi:Holliday junction resolvase RuvX [Portibacter lacus]|uniref:Putative pre-16S rRNA nuclease n=1 Tax=Portibacter lacus TaxID=1099794 RepID=A0AA37SMI7_9BACT|nr:Holliday junction resolvase RuvX [Portibacter lacus]GLR16660.1 putative pre-16S rRNA nuclease [Portibacter lacus]
MGRVIGIDYGAKRCGIAATDILKISINPITVIPPDELIPFLSKYLSVEQVDCLAIGWPTHSDGKETYLTEKIKTFLIKFAKLFPEIEISKVDESFSSSEAKSIIFESGTKKKKRRSKELVDQVSAVLIIKRYLDQL